MKGNWATESHLCHPTQQTVQTQPRALTSNPACTTGSAGTRQRWVSTPNPLRTGTVSGHPRPAQRRGRGPVCGQAAEGTAGRGKGKDTPGYVVWQQSCPRGAFPRKYPHSLQPPPVAARPLPPHHNAGTQRPPGNPAAASPLALPGAPRAVRRPSSWGSPEGHPAPGPASPQNFRGGGWGRRSFPALPAGPRRRRPCMARPCCSAGGQRGCRPRTYLRGPPLARGAAGRRPGPGARRRGGRGAQSAALTMEGGEDGAAPASCLRGAHGGAAAAI